MRQTGAGAIQPMVDRVSDLAFAINGGRVDVSLRVHSSVGSLGPPRSFNTSIALRNRHE